MSAPVAGRRAVRCAEAAETAGDPLTGSAPPADQWLLVEHGGPWGPHALSDSGIEPAVEAVLAGWTSTRRARVVLIRRPGAQPRTEPAGRWYLVDSRPGAASVRTGHYAAEAELLAVLGDPTAGVPAPDPVFLVCTHGRHDTCCALRGRPVAQALAREFPADTWECSHVGGDRFAANLVVLPHGLYYGHASPADAITVAHQHRAGRLVPRLLRGRSTCSGQEQAAQHHARLAGGDATIDGYRVLATEELAPQLWRVRLGPPGATVTVRATRVLAGRRLTCSAGSPGWFRAFELVELIPGR